jgi:hypothetical protein
MANSPLPFFSNIDYYLNRNFIELMRRYHSFLGSDERNPMLLFEWEQVILYDFYMEAVVWLKENKRKTAWRKDLR